MPKVRLVPTALITGASIVGLFTTTTAHLAHRASGGEVWTADAFLLRIAAVGAIYALLYYLGAQWLRRVGYADRRAFTLLGALAALPAFGVGASPIFFEHAIRDGSLVLALCRPLAVGAVAGFLYHRRVGFETEGDDPALLDQLDVQSGHIETITAEYFDGPLQVRSSVMAALVAGICGSATQVLTVMLNLAAAPAFPTDFIDAHGGPGQVALVGAVAIAGPYVLFALAANRVLRAFEATSMISYISAGLLTPCALAAILLLGGLGPFALVLSAPYIVPTAVALASYRALAGLEPKSLPEDIEVSDRRTLVGRDDVRRRVRRVIDVS